MMKQDISPHTETANRLQKASAAMPVLAQIQSDWRQQTPLKGERIALCGHITEASAIQVRTLKALGADIAWCASSTSTTDPGIKTSMEMDGLFVAGQKGMSEDELQQGVVMVRDHWPDGPSMVLDEGARLITAFHAPDCQTPLPYLAAEKTPEGIGELERMDLSFPVLMSDESFGKRLVDNPHGTSQSLVETFLNISKCLLAGKVFVLIGYGRVGAGIADKARGLGARVIVVDVQATRALIAALSGFEILPLEDALTEANVVCTVTGRDGALPVDAFQYLRDGTYLFNGGHSPGEIDIAALKASSQMESFAHGIDKYRFDDGRAVYLLADGNIANLAVGDGNPNEVMDITFASQVLALVHTRKASLPPGLQPLPRKSELEVARYCARSLGIDVSALN